MSAGSGGHTNAHARGVLVRNRMDRLSRKSHTSRFTVTQRIFSGGFLTTISPETHQKDLYEEKCLEVLSGAAVWVTMRMNGVLIGDCRWVDGWWVKRARKPVVPALVEESSD